MKKSIFYLICMLMTMAAIFMFSAQNFENTMKTSDVIVKPVENHIKKTTDKTFETEKAETDYWKKLESKLDLIVRKSAHGFIFGILGLFSVLFFKSLSLEWADAIMYAILLCMLYALSDELLHQKKVDGRNARFQDVCIDTFGAWVGTAIIYFSDKIDRLIKKP